MSDSQEKEEKEQIFPQITLPPTHLTLSFSLQSSLLAAIIPKGCIYHYEKNTNDISSSTYNSVAGPINNVCSVCGSIEAAPYVIKKQARLLGSWLDKQNLGSHPRSAF